MDLKALTDWSDFIKKGEVYECSISGRCGELQVDVYIDKDGLCGVKTIIYSSLKELLEDWEDI